jgi:diacylglycerol O-acyltransferase / wax synthase
MLQSARRTLPVWREVFTEQRAPRTSLNRPIGPDRRLALIRSHLDLAKKIAHAHQAKVNDVLLAAIAGGLRDLLLGRGEHIGDLVLRTMVPVSCTASSPVKRGATKTQRWSCRCRSASPTRSAGCT